MSESLYQRLTGMRPRGGPMAQELRSIPLSGPRQPFANSRPTIPGLQQPAEGSADSQASFYMPGPTVTAAAPLPDYQDGPGAGQMGRPNPMGSMPEGPIPEEPAVAGRSPYARPMPRVPMAMGAPPQGTGGADDLNSMVLAILQGGGDDSEQARRLREQMQMASGPQQGGIY